MKLRYLIPLFIFSTSLQAEVAPAPAPDKPATDTAKNEPAPEKQEEEYKIPDGKTIPKRVDIDANRIKLGLVTVDAKEKSFSFTTVVNMKEGLIEYLVSMPHGKVHETLLTTMADPYHMSIACKLLNFPSFSGMFPERDENLEWKPYKEPKREDYAKSLVEITASWEKDGKKITVPAADLIQYKNTKQKLSSNEWALIDSVLYKKTYQASVIGDVIAIFGDLNALITYTGFDNTGENVWFADTSLVPEIGTEITLTVKMLPKKEAEKPVSRRPKEDIAKPSAEHYLD